MAQQSRGRPLWLIQFCPTWLPKKKLIFVNLDGLRGLSTFATKVSQLYDSLRVALQQGGFQLRIYGESPRDKLQGLIFSLSEVDPDGGQLVIIFDEMQFLYSGLSKVERDSYGNISQVSHWWDEVTRACPFCVSGR
jgi:hypothetical protein